MRFNRDTYSLEQLIESVSSRDEELIKNASFNGAMRGKAIADEIGYHIYSDLSLTLKLKAAVDDSQSQKYLNYLQEYVNLAEGVIENSAIDMNILEVHGERLHFFLPADNIDLVTFSKVLSFSIGFTATVYKRFSHLKDFRSFKMSTDHGRSIMISTGMKGDDSLVSIGPAANEPAKRLKLIKAGYLSVSPRIANGLFNTSDWFDIDVKNPPDYILNQRDMDLESSINNFSDDFDQFMLKEAAKVDEGHTTFNPKRVQGFCMRADLDGFTKKVEDAFQSKNEKQVGTLVNKFIHLMEYADEYAEDLGSHCTVYQLPWAGDCASHVLCREEYYQSRGSFPVIASRRWQEQAHITGKSWGSQFKEDKWVVGIAGGGEAECDGYILMAHLNTRKRQFLVSAGWSTGRSTDACEADRLKGGETAIPREDYFALTENNRERFSELDSNFYHSDGLGDTKEEETKLGRSKETPLIGAPGIFIPQSSPYSQ